jgi:hypothetical protein
MTLVEQISDYSDICRHLHFPGQRQFNTEFTIIQLIVIIL